jgi:diaminopimelate epimerase
MHGLGNDYVYVDLFQEKVSDPVALAIAVSDRHFGIGSDGLILIGPSRSADVSMRVFNADGSEAQMCGNGIRCVAKYAYEHKLARSEEVRVETAAGVKSVRVRVENGRVTSARVDMGEPRLLRRDIPMTGPANEQCVDAELVVHYYIGPATIQQGPVEVLGPHSVVVNCIATTRGVMVNFFATCVSMGNPHCVIFVPDVQAVDLEHLGPAIERHEAFPEGTNVHFVQVVRPDEVIMRTWERGSGITLACGSGASAVCVAGALTGRTGRKLLAHLPGGDLELEFSADNRLFMTGPATEVFTGEWPA